MKLASTLIALALCALLSLSPSIAAIGKETKSVAAAAEQLLAADRAFSAAAADKDVADGLGAMFDADVIMPAPGGTFARGREAALASVRANPANLTAHAQWTPVRVGLSADGQHGFTYGYMTMSEAGKPPRLAKYLAYWVKRPEGWRVAAYKRTGRPEGEVSLAPLPAALPSKLARPSRGRAERYRQSLIAAERSFSDEVQRIGLGPAFKKNGSTDAMNMGQGAGFTMGAETIGTAIGGDLATSPVIWSAEDAIVASTGDLGVTWGFIRPKGAVPEGQPAAIPFFTIWWRADEKQPWRYIAE